MNPESVEVPVYSPNVRFVIEQDISRAEFTCDLGVCKGVCCTMPAERGAPILPSEREELERAFPFVKKYLDEKALNTIDKTGLWRLEADGTFTIPTIGGAECVFVHWDGDIAKCSIQTAYHNQEIAGFEKPISCHLFPIRIYPEAEENSFYICYEKLSECEGGRERGKHERIPLLEFLKLPLVRALGEERITRLIEHLSQ